MAQAKPYAKVALVMGILTSCPEKDNQLLTLLESHFGPVLLKSEDELFSYTDYYDKEMGGKPQRRVLMFRNLIDPSSLADIKILTNKLEERFLGAFGRTVNLDPGYIGLSSFVLATCKDRSHRIPLHDGIYAEVTMIYSDGDFQALPWTYSDYASEGIRAVLRDFRNTYKDLLRKE